MKPVILLLAAAATSGAAPARPPRPAASAPRYEAGGFEPTWNLVIEHGRMRYSPAPGLPITSMPLPRRQPVRNGYRYVTRQLIVDVRHVRCDAYNGRTFADTVSVSGVTEPGCGGTSIPPSTLAYSSWDFESVAGVRPPGDQGGYRLEFDNGRVTVRLGCREYSSTYRERRPVLTLISPTLVRNFCPMSALERRMLPLLQEPLRISWTDGDTLVLTGRGGSMRLTH